MMEGEAPPGVVTVALCHLKEKTIETESQRPHDVIA